MFYKTEVLNTVSMFSVLLTRARSTATQPFCTLLGDYVGASLSTKRRGRLRNRRFPDTHGLRESGKREGLIWVLPEAVNSGCGVADDNRVGIKP